MKLICRAFGIRPPSSNSKGCILNLLICKICSIYESLFSLNYFFCSNFSDMHLVLVPLHNVGFDEYAVT